MSERNSSYRDGDRKRHSRSRSPHRQQHTHSRRDASPHIHRHKKHKTGSTSATILPYNSRPLTKYDYSHYKPMFAQYLDIQKNINIAELGEIESKGRFKSFLGKWNRGELSDGWYDPSTLQKALQTAPQTAKQPSSSANVADTSTRRASPPSAEQPGDSDSDDSVGPVLPGQEKRSKKAGPSIPNMQELEMKREMEAEDRFAQREDLRYERVQDRKSQKEALEELVPRAEAGTRERQLEKKREVNEKMKSFRERSPGATEVPDSELLGGSDEVSEFKKTKESFERKKNERELRKEEMLRARQAEREERLAEYKVKEDKTMELLKAMAKRNFG